ncbi:MAG: sugar phosphate isomerase/epimerase [Anaerolineae bacterium]|nr:sugar phosphate isomerase/epimerase [Anaerolineae bacterium]
MKLGVDVFSLRFQPWNAFEHLEYAAKIGIDLVHFSETGFLDRLDDDYLKQLKARADELGLALEVGMGSICPTSNRFDPARGTAVAQVREMLHVATLLGSGTLRCYLGSNQDRTGELPLAAHIEATIQTCRAVRSQAMDLGIKIAVENHAGDLQGHELAALIAAAGPEYVGACIDAGNPLWVAESPFVTLEHLAPYIVTSHIRDTAVWAHSEGAAVQWMAMGDGTVGIEAWSRQFVAQCPQSSFTLEIITGGPARVLDYFEPSFWAAYSNARAGEFARFVKLVQEGHAPLVPQLVVPWSVDIPEYKAALVVQQRFDLERSVKYCRNVLGVGEK